MINNGSELTGNSYWTSQLSEEAALLP